VTAYRPVHPFPARMAPDLAVQKVARMSRKKAVVLDPMMGSGTFPLVAALHGHRAYGLDSDPLAVLIAQAASSCVDADEALGAAEIAVNTARKVRKSPLRFDPETKKFVEYWFDAKTASELGCLASVISKSPIHLRPVFWCAFSRLIITKDAGASLARDVSHSRPHRTRDVGAFSPLDRFSQATSVVLQRRAVTSWERSNTTAPGKSFNVHLLRGDARRIPLADRSVDAVMTSPPYLVAIDYLRGHRMSLVWMGHSIGELRQLRATNVGSERGLDRRGKTSHIVDAVTTPSMSPRTRRVVNNYVTALGLVVDEMARVLKRSGLLTMVISDAKMEGQEISVEQIVVGLARDANLSVQEREVRLLPPDRRYLPPPKDGAQSALRKRMRQETVLLLAR